MLFTLDTSSTFTVWSPINSWEPHILYQRAATRIDNFNLDHIPNSLPSSPSTGVVLESGDLTAALETYFNCNEVTTATAEETSTMAQLARKAPTLLLAFNSRDRNICIYEIDVRESDLLD